VFRQILNLPRNSSKSFEPILHPRELLLANAHSTWIDFADDDKPLLSAIRRLDRLLAQMSQDGVGELEAFGFARHAHVIEHLFAVIC